MYTYECPLCFTEAAGDPHLAPSGLCPGGEPKGLIPVGHDRKPRWHNLGKTLEPDLETAKKIVVMRDPPPRSGGPPRREDIDPARREKMDRKNAAERRRRAQRALQLAQAHGIEVGPPSEPVDHPSPASAPHPGDGATWPNPGASPEQQALVAYLQGLSDQWDVPPK